MNRRQPNPPSDASVENSPISKNQTTRTPATVGAIVGAVVAAVVAAPAGRLAVQTLLGSGDQAIDRELVETADKINKTLPMMVDGTTRLDSTAALPGKTLLYRYTLLDLQPGLTAEPFEAAMRPRLVNNYKTSQDMAGLRENRVTLAYQYFDEAGNEFSRIEISTDEF